MRKILLAVAIVAVLAFVFTSVGYAYTASTENSGNNVTSQYVTLTQQNYTFTNTSLSFDVIETEAGIRYQLVGTNYVLTDIDGDGYVGVLIGSDKLTATVTGFPDGYLGIELSAWNIDGGWFTDFSGDLNGWRYILKVTPDTGTDPVQWAYYDGHVDEQLGYGIWKVKGTTIAGESYTVSARDADAGNYIVLYSAANPLNKYTVLKVASGGAIDVISNQSAGADISLEGDWYVNGKAIDGNSYDVTMTDANAGGYIVLYQAPVSSGYKVLKVDNGTVTPESKSSGQTVSGVHGWTVDGGYKLKLMSGVTYTTQLYFAGDGGNVNSSLRSIGTTIKATSSITIMPEWVPAGQNDVLKYTLSSGEGSGADRVVYVNPGSTIMLPENCFTAPAGKVFVGWSSGEQEKVFTSQHVVSSYTQEKTYTAQWAEAVEVVKYSGSAWAKVIVNDAKASEISALTPTSGDTYHLVDAGKLNNGDLAVTADDVVTYVSTAWVKVEKKTVEQINEQINGLSPGSGDIYRVTDGGTIKLGGLVVTGGDCWIVSYDSNTGYGSMDIRYVLKNADSGNTFTLPAFGFTKPGYKLTGWAVTGHSGRDYSDYWDHFVDIPAVKENLLLTAQWEEAAVGGEDVSISFNTNTVVVIPSEGDPYVVSGKYIGETVTLTGTWYVNGVEFSGNYVLKEADVVHGGYIVLYQDKNAENKYRYIKVEGDWIQVVSTPVDVGAEVDGVGGWRVNGASVYGGQYKVRAIDADSDESRFIVVYEEANSKDEYTVIKVPATGNSTIIKGLYEHDVVTFSGTWYVRGHEKLGQYTVDEDDAVNGFIVLYETANETGKYSVVKVGAKGSMVLKNKSVDDVITGIKGWKVRGFEIGIYTVRAADAISDGYILIYDNAAATYLVHSNGNGNYTIPYCIMAPPEDPGIEGFKGWKLIGWQVIGTPGKDVAQSFTMPYGTDGHIVSNGIIKFRYSNDLHNGEEIA